MSQLTQDFVDTDPGLMNPEEVVRQAKVMAQYREREALARSTTRCIVALIVVSAILAWNGWI